VTHRRYLPIVICAIFLVVSAVLATEWPLFYVLLFFGGLYGLIVTVISLSIVRVAVQGDVLEYRGYIGRPAIRATPQDIVAARFCYVLRHPWQPNVDFWVFEIEVSGSGAPVLIPMVGWTSNRALFVELRRFLASSNARLNDLTRRQLDRASG
jgi:hypothetical protein